MGLWSALETAGQRMLTGAGPRDRKAAAWETVPIGVQGRPQYPDTDTASLLGVYRRNELVYAAINRRAASAIGPHLRVQQRADDHAEWTEIPGHPLRRLLMRPNTMMDEAALLKAILVSLDISGRFYGEIVRSPMGSPAAIHPLNPAKVAPIPGPGNLVAQYEFRDGATKVLIPAANMLTLSEYDPSNPAWGGLSRLAVCLGTVDADNAQTDFVRAFFNNAGVPSGLLKVKGTWTQQQADSLRGKWRERYARTWGRQHDVAVLDDNAEYQQVGAHLDQLENETIRSISESRVCMTFGVPPLIIYAYVGLLRATYSNLDAAWKWFWDTTLSSLYEELRSWLEWGLLTEYVDPELIFAERVRLMWDFSAVAGKQEDETAKHSRAKEAFVAGGLTLNEYRVRLGEQPDPAGNYYLRTLTQVEVPAGTLPDAAGAAPGKALPRPYATKGAAVRRDRAGIDRHLAQSVETYLQAEYDAAARAVEAP